MAERLHDLRSTSSPTLSGGRIGMVAATAVAVTALLALTGWALDIEVLRTVVPGRVAMNPMTAIALLCATGALSLGAGCRFERLAALLAILTLGFGLVKLGSYFFGGDLGLDRWLFSRQLDAEAVPNRMAPNTALCFALTGSALWFLVRERRIALGQLLALASGLIAFFALLGYAYDFVHLYRVAAHIPMALNTAVAFVLLSLGALALGSHEGLVSVFASPAAGGFLARRLLPGAIAIPAILGGIRLWGERAGFYGTETGVLLTSVSSMILLAGLVFWTARTVDRADRERRAAAEKSREASLFFESIFENLPLIGFVKEARDLRYVRLNRAGEELLGVAREDFVGKNDFDFFPAEQAAFFAGKDREVLDGAEPVDIPEEPIQTPSGARLLHTRKLPLFGPDGQPRYLLGISEDITERRLAEERVERLNRELEAFSYSVSHDLRAPLRGIVGFSQALLEDQAERLDDDGRRLVSRIVAAGHRMGQLIDDLLAFSRLSRADLHRRRVDFTALAHEVERNLREADSGRDIEVVVAEGMVAEADPHLARVLLENVLGNAWKYTGKVERPRIEMGVAESHNGSPRTFFVEDNGAGFDMTYAEKLFAPFQRLHAAHEFEGTGIGLATVQRIVERHGGRAWAEGAVGKGATFYFTLEGNPRWTRN
jgi:PAS domain S-box-containing protein